MEVAVINIFEIWGSIGLKDEGFAKGISEATGKGKGFGDVLAKAGEVAVKAVAAIGTGLTALGTAAIKVGMDFEASMSEVAATMGITADKSNADFKLISDAAKEMGATTKFTASEAGVALNYLALAGFDAEKATGALPSVLNLAAAGGLALGQASELATQSMNALGVSADDLEGFTDQLAKTAQKSGTNVSQLGEAVLTVGATAKELSGGTTELNTILGILADNAYQGAEGGTKLRNIMLSLGAPTDKAAGLLKDLGVNAYDVDGNLKPLNETFLDLNAAMADMTSQEKMDILNNIFNKQDIGAVNALLGTSADRWDELSGYIENSQGAAAQMAATMNDNLKGAITILNSALEGLGIQFYESIDSPLKEIVQSATDMIGDLSQAFTEGGLSGAAESIGDILSTVVSMIVDYAPIVVDAAIQLIGGFISGIQQNLPTIASGAVETVMTFVYGILDLLPDILDLGLKLIAELALGIAKSLPELIPAAVDTILSFVETIIDNIDLLVDAALQLIIGLSEGIIAALPILIEKAPEIISKLVVGIIKALPQIWDAAGNIVQMLINGIWDMLPSLMTIGFDIIEQLAAAFGIDLSPILNVGRNIIEALWGGISGLGRWLTDNVLGFFKNVVSEIKSLLGIRSPSTVFSEMGGNLIKGLWEGINALVSWAKTNIINFFSGIVDSVKDFPKKFIDIGTNMIKGLWQGIQDVSGWLWDKISGFFGGVVDKIKNFFGIASPSKMFAGFGKNIGQGFANGILAMTDTVSGAMDDVFGGIDKSIDITPKLGRISASSVSDAVGTGASDIQGRSGVVPGGIQLGPNYFYVNSELDAQHISNQLARQIETAMRGRGIVTA